MATDHQDDDSLDANVDVKVRSALEPSHFAVDRVVKTALSDEPEGRAPAWGRRYAVAGATFVVAVAVAVVVFLRAPVHAPGAQPPAAPAVAESSRPVISNEGSIIVITAPNRPITLISPAAAAAPPLPSGTMTIEVLGESR